MTLNRRKITIFRKLGVSLNLGSENLIWSEISDKSSLSYLILINSRLPRTITVILAGFGISIAGLIFQQISQNKFVSPTTSGSVSGAQLGIALSMVLMPVQKTAIMMIFAFVTSIITTLIFMTILDRIKFREVIYVPLLGMMIASLISSITTIIAYRYNFLQAIQGWMYGSFSLMISGRYELIFIVAIAIMLAFIYAKSFTISAIGQSFATNLGLNYQGVVRLGIFISSLVSSTIVVVVGSIPFLGLIVPNIVVLYAGDNLQKNILDVGLVGVIILLTCDILSRLIIYPYELPIAFVVGILGAFGFILMLLKKGGIS